MSNLNWVDYILIILFFLNMLLGFSRGFVKEIISLLTIIAGFIIATMFSNALASAFTNSTTVQNAVTQSASAIGVNTAVPVSYVALALSFAVLFAATVIVGSIISTVLNLAFQAGILGIGNRLLGAVFGFCRGFIINLVLIFLVQLTSLSSEPWWQHSQLVADYQGPVVWLGNVVSPALVGLKNRFGQTIQNVGSTFQNMTNSVTGGGT